MRVSRYPYRLINVFAEGAFSGKTVAVFTDSTRLETEQMGAIARELNLPQCSFVFPAEGEQAVPRVRSFTPTVELPRAGLPMIAAVFALELEQKALSAQAALSERFGTDSAGSLGGRASRVVLDQSEGPVSVAVFSPILTIRQPAPIFGSPYRERETVAAMLSLRPDQLGVGPLEVASSGVPYLLVPVKNLQALSAIRIREEIWERTLQYFEAPSILVFCTKGTAQGVLAEMRVFTPSYGVPEESASEGACGPLLGYLLRHNLVELPRVPSLILRQGTDLGRPSNLHVTYELQAGELAQLRVGGQCRLVGEGTLFV